MRVALTIYGAVYLLVSTFVIIVDFQSKESLWDKASDLVLLPLGLVGIILYGFGAGNPEVKSMWKLVAPLIVIGQVGTNLLGRYVTMKHTATDRDAVRFADVLTAIFLLPMFMSNLAFAFR